MCITFCVKTFFSIMHIFADPITYEKIFGGLSKIRKTQEIVSRNESDESSLSGRRCLFGQTSHLYLVDKSIWSDESSLSGQTSLFCRISHLYLFGRVYFVG